MSNLFYNFILAFITKDNKNVFILFFSNIETLILDIISINRYAIIFKMTLSFHKPFNKSYLKPF